MWLFILSDSLTFSALLISYSYVRLASPNWPRIFQVWPSITVATVMTFCLLSSSLTMVMGVAAAQRGDRAATAKWIGATIAGGLMMLVLARLFRVEELSGLVKRKRGATGSL